MKYFFALLLLAAITAPVAAQKASASHILVKDESKCSELKDQLDKVTSPADISSLFQELVPTKKGRPNAFAKRTVTPPDESTIWAMCRTAWGAFAAWNKMTGLALRPQDGAAAVKASLSHIGHAKTFSMSAGWDLAEAKAACKSFGITVNSLTSSIVAEVTTKLALNIPLQSISLPGAVSTVFSLHYVTHGNRTLTRISS